MADATRMAPAELRRKVGAELDADLLSEGVRALAQELMELEGTERLGAARYTRDAELPQRVRGADLGHAGGHDRAGGVRPVLPFAIAGAVAFSYLLSTLLSIAIAPNVSFWGSRFNTEGAATALAVSLDG